MKTIIVTFAKGNPRYIHAARAQEESLRAKGYNGAFRCYDLENQLGCPSHKDVPYAFKAFAIKKAFDEGYDNIIWLDSVIQAVAPIDKLLAHVEETGFVFFDNYTYTIGSYCNQNCKEVYDITEEELQAPMIMACVMGFNREHAAQFIADYYQGALNGSFRGEWDGEDRHRHDQTVASLLIKRHNLPILQGHETYFMYFAMTGLEFVYNDKKFHLTRGEDVCLMSI